MKTTAKTFKKFNCSERFLIAAEDAGQMAERLTGNAQTGITAQGLFFKGVAEQILYGEKLDTDAMVSISGLDETVCTVISVLIDRAYQEITAPMLTGLHGAEMKKQKAQKVIQPLLTAGLEGALDEYE